MLTWKYKCIAHYIAKIVHVHIMHDTIPICYRIFTIKPLSGLIPKGQYQVRYILLPIPDTNSAHFVYTSIVYVYISVVCILPLPYSAIRVAYEVHTCTCVCTRTYVCMKWILHADICDGDDATRGKDIPTHHSLYSECQQWLHTGAPHTKHVHV